MATSAAASASTTGSTPSADADRKILRDLATVKEKMELCSALLKPDGAGAPAPSFKTPGTPLLDVIGFLEACAPRMVELVEAAAQGALGEEAFASALEINDQLQKLLADVETQALTETTASTTAAAAATANTNNSSAVEEAFDDLLLDDEPVDHKANLTAGTKTTGEDDDEEDAKKPAVAPAPAAAPTVEPTKSDDEFDDFFATRTGSS
jgi:hypothetical protein